MGAALERRSGEGAGKIARSAYGLLCRTALHLGQEHPEISFRRDYLLRLIAKRLGVLCTLALRREGVDSTVEQMLTDVDPAPLGTDFLEEIQLFNQADHEDLQEMREDAEDG